MEEYSDCCSAPRHHLYDELCGYCLEHCEFESYDESEQDDLFDSFDVLPKDIREILLSLDEDKDRYKEVNRIKNELETQGYTFDYGLDGCPFNLRKL